MFPIPLSTPEAAFAFLREVRCVPYDRRLRACTLKILECCVLPFVELCSTFMKAFCGIVTIFFFYWLNSSIVAMNMFFKFDLKTEQHRLRSHAWKIFATKMACHLRNQKYNSEIFRSVILWPNEFLSSMQIMRDCLTEDLPKTKLFHAKEKKCLFQKPEHSLPIFTVCENTYLNFARTGEQQSSCESCPW